MRPRATWRARSAGWPCATDVSVPGELVSLVEQATRKFGPIDLFCSNAGIETGGGIDAPDEAWQRIWQVNVMAHVYAARAVLPGMLARGAGTCCKRLRPPDCSRR